jgi:uncharacterized membrane protein
MNCQSINTQYSKIASIIFVLVPLFFLVVFLDIPIARQVIGFLFVTFISGIVSLKILKLDKLNKAETVIFSVGLSIAFLIITGLLINEFSLLFGFSRPLSPSLLMIIFNSLVLIGGIFVCLKSEDEEIWKSGPIKKSPFELIFLCLPILSIVGTMLVNAHGNISLLLFMIVAISVLFAASVLSKKFLSPNLYPFAVLMIAIAILYHSSLISNYIVPFGSDVPGEYFLFKLTESNAHWTSVGLGRYNAMLSITILPTVYSVLLKIDSIWMFKLLFPLIFAFVPLGLYQVWQTYVSKKYAFISAFLFMAQSTFYTEVLGLTRQMIGEFFFVLLLLVIVNKGMKPVRKMVCFMVFSFALVVSHYALAAIFLFFISFALVALFALKRPSRNITVGMVVFFSTVMFTWYIYTARATTFDSILEVGDYVYRQLGYFFNPAARGETVLRGLGLESPPTVWNAIGRFFAYITEAFIVLGFVGLVSKRIKIHIENEFLIFSVIGMAFLGMLILVPGLANTLNMTRFYHILLFFLAPLCVLGAEFIVKLFSRREKEFAVSALLLIVLIPYFLFQTNFVYEVTGSDSWSIPLSGYRMNALRLYGHFGYTRAYDVYGAQWCSRNVNDKNTTLYADERTFINVLIIYGLTCKSNPLTNTTLIVDNGVVYLSVLNVVHEQIPFGQFLWNTSELSFIFDDLNLIYSNGGSEICKHLP